MICIMHIYIHVLFTGIDCVANENVPSHDGEIIKVFYLLIYIYLYINLRRSRDCLCVSLAAGRLRCPHKRIVTITKVYIARNNIHVEQGWGRLQKPGYDYDYSAHKIIDYDYDYSGD